MKSFKNHLNESRTYISEDSAGGADYEAAIVMGYYSVQKMEVPSASDLDISTKDYNLVLKNQVLRDGGERIAKRILPKVGKKKSSRQLGRGNFPLTKEWKSTGASNKTPKTDLMIGNSRISLKIGPAQLMSGGKSESMATFKAAIKENPGLSRKKIVKELLGDLDNFVERGLTKDGTVNDYIKGSKAGKDSVISEADLAHKEMIRRLNTLFEDSPEFRNSFAKEAMSGIHKFGVGSDATAEFFLVGDKTGSKVSYHSINDSAYVAKVAEVMKPTVRFKSSSQKKTVGGKKVKTGSYNYWSVVSLVVNKMDTVVEQAEREYQDRSSSALFINENRQMIRENIFRKAFERVKNFIKDLFLKVKTWLKESVSNIIEFLNPEMDISVNGLDSKVVLPF